MVARKSSIDGGRGPDAEAIGGRSQLVTGQEAYPTGVDLYLG